MLFSPRQGTRSIPYVVKLGESVTSIAWHYLSQSVYMRRTELEDAIRQVNGLKTDRLKPGQTLRVPGIPIQPVLDKPVTVPRDFQARAIYLTGWTAGSARGLELIKKWKSVGGNAVVFDIKDFDGVVRVPFDHPYVSKEGITIHNLPKYIHWLHSLNMHVIARIALFRDAHLAQTYPELDIRSRKTGKPWLENGKLAWVDPSLPVVQDYQLDLAKMVAGDGADEIQFDYVRFPAEGDQADAKFAYEKDHPDWPRSKIITDFAARAYQELHPKGVLVSLDVFGVMAWARPVDLEHTGQNIAQLAQHCDVISPMI
ncbi:MAG: putative glycoside hydrolase, partial [Terriglobia bacterium]